MEKIPKNMSLMFCIVFLIVGIVGVALAFGDQLLIMKLKIQGAGLEVTARVTSVREDWIYIVYQVDGKSYTYPIEYYGPKVNVGENYVIIVDTNNPENFASKYPAFPIIALIVLIFPLVSLWFGKLFISEVFWAYRVKSSGVIVEAVVEDVVDHPNLLINDEPVPMIVANYRELYFTRSSSYRELENLLTHVKIQYLERNPKKYVFLMREPVSVTEYFFEEGEFD